MKYTLRAISILFILLFLWLAFLPALVIAGLMADRPGKPAAQTREVDAAGETVEVDIYKSRGPAWGALVIFHAANERGKDDERLVKAAGMFARVGQIVYAPTLPAMNREKFHPDVIDQMTEVIELAAAEKLPLTIFSFSIGVGPELIAASRPETRDDIDLVVVMGGYMDLENVIRFHSTGAYKTNGQIVAGSPLDPFGTWLFARYYAQFLPEGDAAIMRQIAERKLDDPKADISDLAGRFGAEGEKALELIVNTDPEAVEGLIARLPPELQEFLAALDPAPHLKNLKAEVLLLHSARDRIIPAVESEKLEAAFSAARIKTTFYRLEVFDHVNLVLPRLTPKSLLRVYIPELAKMYRSAFKIIY